MALHNNSEYCFRRADIAPNLPLPSSSYFSPTHEKWRKNPLIQIEFPYKSWRDTLDVPPYDLAQLCHLSSKRQDIESEEKYLLRWLSENFEEFQSTDKFSVLDEKQTIVAFKNLIPFITPETMRADVCLVDNNFGLPLLLFEMNLSRILTNYYSQLVKCVASLIFQFRYFRQFSLDTDHVFGYVFPKLNQKTIVTEVRLEYKCLKFRASFKFLGKEQVIESIRKVLAEQCNLSKIGNLLRTPKKDYFIGLNQEDLDYLQKEIVKSDSKLEQVISAYSILVHDENYYYKINPRFCEYIMLAELEWKTFTKTKIDGRDTFKHLVLPTMNLKDPSSQIRLFRFKAQHYSHLTTAEALRCLRDFVTYAIDALNEFHEFGYVHTDVRLPNFIFSKEFELKLISFDRAKFILKLFIPEIGDLFLQNAPKTNQSFIGLDFKQLGLLILLILNPNLSLEPKKIDLSLKKCEENDKMQESFRELIGVDDIFLFQLIFHGKYEVAELNSWKEDYPDLWTTPSPVSISDILSRRI